MKRRLLKIGAYVLGVCVLLVALLAVLAYEKPPERITYGMSFNTPYATELGLDWREVYDAMLDDLGVRHLRLAAHWDLVEHDRDRMNYAELDYQIARAETEGAEVIFAVGKRLPRWPECHEPEWTDELPEAELRAELREYITTTVNRYKDSDAITHWQVENEPYLEVFADEHCGDLAEAFLEEKIALVRELDPTRPILMTDSGNLGTWYKPYRLGDVFGTSVYLYFWNPELGQFKSVLPPEVYRIKKNVMHLLFEEKPVYLIELSLEPWLVDSVVDTPLGEQLSRMDIEKFDEVIEYARETRLNPQYLWGGEWWYYLMEVHGDDRFWEKGKALFEASE